MAGLSRKFAALALFLLALLSGNKSEARHVSLDQRMAALEGAAHFSPASQDTAITPEQPKSALFHKESSDSRPAVGTGWFLFGLYVLIALLFSGLSGYTAVSKGLNPIPYFFAGFFLGVFGYLYVLIRPSTVQPGEVPSGLVKVPTTLEPVPCPKCGYTNHPAAKKCSGCGAALQPSAQSEVTRVK